MSHDFDRGARHTVKLKPEVMLSWLFPRLAHLRFKRWHDSQSAPRPGEPDRRCDTLAELIDPDGASAPWTAVIELFTESDADALDRGVEYVGRFRRELRHGPYGHDRYHFALVLVFLTTVPEQTQQQDELPGHEEDVFFNVRPRILALAQEDGVALLNRIDENPTWRPLLAWLPVMRGGQTAEAARRWRTLVEQETDEVLRKTLGDLVLILADLTDSRPVWHKALEGFAVRESTYLREARMEGRVESRQEDLVRVLRARFPGEPLEEVEQRVRKQQQFDELSRWFDLALSNKTLDEFRAATGG
jgi:hypothetical protein